MKELTKKLLVGSKYFFTVFNDFAPKDSDFVIIVEPNEEFRFAEGSI